MEKFMAKNIFNDEDYLLWLLLILVKDMIHRARLEELQQISITASEAGVLFYTEALGNKATPAEISRCLFKRPHAISTLISKMEIKGLVRKINDLDRKNLVRVELTAKGKQTFKSASERAVIHRILSSLSAEEKRQLNSSLGKLRSRALSELGLKKRSYHLGYES
jgi:MarR family multiple antibiotic resistance transcriptional regulator